MTLEADNKLPQIQLSHKPTRFNHLKLKGYLTNHKQRFCVYFTQNNSPPYIHQTFNFVMEKIAIHFDNLMYHINMLSGGNNSNNNSNNNNNNSNSNSNNSNSNSNNNSNNNDLNF